MLRATIWRDLRWRLLAAALLVVPLAALVAWSYAARAHAGQVVERDYLAYLDHAWFRLPGPSAVFTLAAVVLTAGSGLLRPREDVRYLLALPVSRRRLLLTYVALALTALGALIALVDLVLAGGALGAGVPLPFVPLILRSLGVFAAAAVWVCVTVGVLSVVRYPILSLALVLGAVALLPSDRFRLELPAVASAATLGRWDVWAFADPRSWQGSAPLASLAAAAAVGVAGLLLAWYQVQHFEP
jgi:ABC-type multidrug transport system permease subunit